MQPNRETLPIWVRHVPAHGLSARLRRHLPPANFVHRFAPYMALTIQITGLRLSRVPITQAILLRSSMKMPDVTTANVQTTITASEIKAKDRPSVFAGINNATTGSAVQMLR